MKPLFKDRVDAGRTLAEGLRGYSHRDDVIVLALPRGGVPVAYEVARVLDAEFDVLVVRKLGVPHDPELAMGAIASGGAQYLDEEMASRVGVAHTQVVEVLAEERRELARRETLYRGNRSRVRLSGRTVIVVDDGVATGASMRVAVAALRPRQPARVVIAVPVAPADTAEWLVSIADEFVCTHVAGSFLSVGGFYENFDQTTDTQVRALFVRSHEDAL